MRYAVRQRRWYLQEAMRHAHLISEPRKALYLTEEFHESAKRFAERGDSAVR